MKLKKLRVVFENIDSYDVPLAAVKEFHVSGVEKTIDYSSYSLTVEQICRKFTATFFVDELQKIDTVENVTLDERLDSHNYADLCMIDLVTDDGKETTIRLPWEEMTYPDHNDVMKTWIEEDFEGRQLMYISVGQVKSLSWQ